MNLNRIKELMVDKLYSDDGKINREFEKLFKNLRFIKKLNYNIYVDFVLNKHIKYEFNEIIGFIYSYEARKSDVTVGKQLPFLIVPSNEHNKLNYKFNNNKIEYSNEIYIINDDYRLVGFRDNNEISFSITDPNTRKEIIKDKKEIIENLKNINNSFDKTKDFYLNLQKILKNDISTEDINSFVNQYKEYKELLILILIVSESETREKLLKGFNDNKIILPPIKILPLIEHIEKSMLSIDEKHLDPYLNKVLQYMKNDCINNKGVFQSLNNLLLKNRLENKLENNNNAFIPKQKI